MKKYDFEIKSPSALIAVVFGMIFFAVIGILLVFYISDSGTEDVVEDYIVTDPSLDKSCDLKNPPDEVHSVMYYNGTAWTTLTAADYTLSGSTLTVKASAMD
jgi:hypothetical protein